MKNIVLSLILCSAINSFCLASDTLYSIILEEPIGATTSIFFEQSLETAIKNNASGLIIKLDTPGGLDKSMRNIIKNILSSPIPIICYVSPSGSRAASAGTYILYASHISAMAPGTNVGSATPITFGQQSPYTENQEKNKSKGTHQNILNNKIINDAIAYIESLANLRNRNSSWAKEAVKETKNITETEALDLNVIDIIAKDEHDLINQIQEKKLLNLEKKPSIISLSPSWKIKLLTIISQPDIAYMLFIAGIYCLIIELSNPGLIVPGVTGSLTLILALYGLHILPLSWIGIILLSLGIGLLITELFIPAYGLLGLSGTGIFILGSIMLIEPNQLGLTISGSIIMITGLINIIFFFFIISIIIKTKKQPSSISIHNLIGKKGLTLENINNKGQIKIKGEIWNAFAEQPIKKNTSVIIEEIQGLKLKIKAVKEVKKNE